MKLYYVALYNHQANEWARVLLTADLESDATATAEEAFNDPNRPRWKVKTVYDVCSTDDDVWIEM